MSGNVMLAKESIGVAETATCQAPKLELQRGCNLQLATTLVVLNGTRRSCLEYYQNRIPFLN